MFLSSTSVGVDLLESRVMYTDVTVFEWFSFLFPAFLACSSKHSSSSYDFFEGYIFVFDVGGRAPVVADLVKQ